jgi:demethylmenaquinone methyltransferase/2-methoxy-6-polyprenyl-1,4-benzoquinol methylase
MAMNFINQKDIMILDICTGTATNAIAVANRYKEARIIGIDISKEMLHIAKNKVQKLDLNNIKLYEMNATETTFKDNTFDVILISLVLHEVPEELAEKILKEAKRLLKPEGKLLIIE